ncbi:MAG: nitric oxide reductase activation protein [Gammaproteobacteria bacterium]|nr:nitric oxide reductase activation protein [Gammaproteobacteria bacterium]
MSEEATQNFLNRIRIRKDLERFTGGAVERYSRIDELIAQIAALDRAHQDFIYEWSEIIAHSNNELAAQFIAMAPDAFRKLGRDGVLDWVNHAMTAFDNRGLGSAIEILKGVGAFAADYAGRSVRCEFEDAGGFLRHFVRGLGGRELRIASDHSTFTDTESLFLPDAFGIFPVAEDNFALYKLTATHLWAQTWYGTWRYQVVEKLIRHFPSGDAIPVFNRLECLRLDACVARDFPGLYREFEALGHKDAETGAQWAQWRARAAALIEPGATGEDSLRLIDEFSALPLPPLKHYQGEMFPGKVREAMYARIDREKTRFQRALQALRDGQDAAGGGDDADESPKQMIEFTMSEGGEQNAGINVELTMDGQAVNVPEHLQELISSIMADFGEIPEQHLQPTDLGDYNDELQPQAGSTGSDNETDANLPGSFKYDEWDYVRQRFRDGFCTLSELAVTPGDESFVDETLDKHRGLLKSIKKTFEAVLGEPRLQRRQSDGDDIDLDAVIEAYADAAHGREMSEYLHTRYRNQERNIAVMFMVDMSGSTLGWVNDAEREALVLLCEALEMLGDRYAIYGFSGRTNKRCEVYRIKEFEHAYDVQVRQRISGIRPKAYTRMGAPIRHLGQLLHLTSARTKLLITLSDGRPEDYGGYKGKYGIEDTRHALLEMKQSGIHAFCITIDNEAQEYLPHMYGAANYAVIDEVHKLPHKVADIYRRLTT